MGHVLGMPYQRFANTIIINEKMAHGLSYASILNVQINIYKCITFLNKYGKG
jgi:hypothetical protein